MAGVVATWDDVLRVAKNEEDLADLQLFTMDTVSRIDIGDAPGLHPFELTIDGQVYTYEKPIDTTPAENAAAIISYLNANRTLFYLLSATAGDFDDQIKLRSKNCLDPFSVSVGGYLTATTGTPFIKGGRTRVLEEAAEQVKESVYGDRLQTAQTYLAAHIAIQQLVPAPGQGTISSEVFDGETISYTMPENNPVAGDEEKTTVYGERYLRIRKRKILSYRVFG